MNINDEIFKEFIENSKLFSKNKHLHEEIDNDERISIFIKKGEEEYEISNKSKALFYAEPAEYKTQISAATNIYRNKMLRSDEYEDNNQSYEKLLNRLKNKATVIPFIGAGFSVPAGCPSWSDYIKTQARKARLPEDEVKEKINQGLHEQLMSEVVTALTMSRFKRDFELAFKNNTITPELSPCMELGKLFEQCVITTNFDRVLEDSTHLSFAEKPVGTENSGRFIRAIFSGDKYLLKLHGNIDEEQDRVLMQEEYNLAYGTEEIDWSLPIPKKLKKIFESFSVIFLGCSLINDRYLNVLKEVRENQEDFMPEHFAILTAPDNYDEQIVRDGFLASLGITPIWFSEGDWDAPSEILSLIKKEL